MKKLGCSLEYGKERIDDMMRVYEEYIRTCDYIRMPDAFKAVANQPAKRFYVSSSRATVVIAAMLRGDKLCKMRPTKREMFQEILKRVLILRESNPNLSLYRLVSTVVEQPAPKFYLTSGSAKVMIYKERKRRRKWKQERLQRYLR